MPRLILSALLACLVVQASVHAAPAKPAPNAPADATAVHLGDSIVSLNGPWKFRVGDSPLDPATGKPLWAEPNFDDSSWENVDLTPKDGSHDPIAGTSRYVQGWTAKGHPGYWGYAWYRFRVQIDTRSELNLALAGPSDIDDAYQAYDNGQLIGSFGDFSRATPSIMFTQPMMFPLSSSGENADHSTRLLAFRVWMESTTLTQADDVGGMHTSPLIGQASSVAAQYQMGWDEQVRSYVASLIGAVVYFLLGLVALSLVPFDRSDRVYWWISATLLAVALQRLIVVIGSWTQWFGANELTVLRTVVLDSLIFAGWVMVWRLWFRLRRPVWIPWILPLLTVLLMLSLALDQDLFFFHVSAHTAHFFDIASLWLRLALALLSLVMVFQGIREQGWEGWIALPVVLLAGVSAFAPELQFLHILQLWFPFGVQITMRQLADLLLVLLLAVLLIRRLALSMRSQRLMALDVKQAQEVQQVILPEAHTELPGLTVESEYRPAREVGGDFFQIMPHKTDGSLLIVAGDVTGKGLKAGMLVALLVGAIRSTAEQIEDPLGILEALNRRLMGRGDAQATCLVLRIHADGSAVLANAGHMPPYINGKQLSIDGALPLGMIENADFSVTRFQLHEEDHLVLLSDGIAEATDVNGHLFGFERIQEMLRTATSAHELATVAQKFGQEDDISVISITRTGIPVAEVA